MAELYRIWGAGAEPTAENVAVARFDDLAENNFVIDPGRYIALPPTTSDLDEAVHERSELLDRLERLSQASRDADDQLRLSLEARR